MRNNTLFPISTLSLLLVISSCSSLRPAAPLFHDTSAEMTDSAVDIVYIRGRNHHRILVQAKDAKYTAQIEVDHEVIHHSDVGPARYQAFLAEATAFLAKPQPNPKKAAPCRSPFAVIMTVGKESHANFGCRPLDDGAVSRLAKDGELLLFLKK